MEQQLTEIVIPVFVVAVVIFFNVYFFRWLYLKGWQPLIFVLIGIGWQRLKFSVAWLRFSRRYDKLHGFLDLAERTRRKPVAGLLESDKNEES
jgi:hypothetical protein